MKLRAMAAMAVAVVLLGACSCGKDEAAGSRGGGGSGPKVDLRLKFTEGATHRQNFVMDQAIDQQVQGRSITTDQKMSFRLKFDVERVEPGGIARLRTTYEQVGLEQDSMMGTVKYDSDNPPSNVPMQAKPFAALVGQSFTAEVAPEGQVGRIEGTEKIAQAVLNSLPAGARQMAGAQVKKQFDRDAIKAIMNQGFGYIPEKPVAVGDSWTKNVAISSGYPMLAENRYTLAERKNGKLHIDVDSTIKPAPDGEPMQMGPMTMRADLSGTQTGSMVVDEATAWVDRSELEQDISGTLKIENANQSIPMIIKSTITLETLEQGEAVSE